MVEGFVSPSRLAAESVARQPLTAGVSTEDTGCAMCGADLPKNSACMPTNFGSSFVDRQYLARPDSSCLCGYCAVVRDKIFLQQLSKSVIAEGRIYRFASNNDRAYFFLHPPKPPFLMFATNAQQQHLVWRTPVSYSTKVFFVRYGHALLTIRHERLMRGLAAARALVSFLNIEMNKEETEVLNEKKPAKKRKKRLFSIRSPFLTLDRELACLHHGTLRPQLLQATDSAVRVNTEILQSLNAGELWALTALLYVEDPVRPQPIDPESLNTTKKENTDA